MLERFCLTILLFLPIASFAQTVEDSTKTDSATVVDSANADSSQKQVTPAVNAGLDSLKTLPPDSTAAAADSTKPPAPLFDFRDKPALFLRGLAFDSTFIAGSRYVSFGDVLDWVPGAYFYDLGSAGQLAYASVFGAPMGEMAVTFDGLNLYNPLTGLADLNLLPTESLGHAGITHSTYKPYGYLPLGQSLYFESRTIADNPIRSQVGYRTGYYDYNDVDVRVGVKASQKLWLDFGGVIRSNIGQKVNAAYSGTQINLKVNRRLGANWLARYVVLFNLRDTQVPLPGAVKSLPAFTDPKSKDRRTDHGLILRHKDNFLATLQYTIFDQDVRASSRSVFSEHNDVQMLQGATELTLPLGVLSWRSGLRGLATLAKSNSWGSRGDWQVDAYSSLAGSLSDRLHWYAGGRFEKNEAYDPNLLPEGNLFFALDSTSSLSLWANQSAVYPSMLARYGLGPYAFGNASLAPAKYGQFGLAGEKAFEQLFLHASLGFLFLDNQIATKYDSIAAYANIGAHSTLSLSALLDYRFLDKWRFVFKGNLFSEVAGNAVVTNRPNLYAKTFLQYHLVRFKGDLNAQLRIGAFILGERLGPLPFYADYTPATVRLAPAIYPYFHAVLTYRTADIFIAYENPIEADVQYVYGYSMPQLWFRYGFVWHFID